MNQTHTAHCTTTAGGVAVVLTEKEYEMLQLIQRARQRTGGNYGDVLIRFVHGQIQVYNIATQPENVR